MKQHRGENAEETRYQSNTHEKTYNSKTDTRGSQCYKLIESRTNPNSSSQNPYTFELNIAEILFILMFAISLSFIRENSLPLIWYPPLDGECGDDEFRHTYNCSAKFYLQKHQHNRRFYIQYEHVENHYLSSNERKTRKFYRFAKPLISPVQFSYSFRRHEKRKKSPAKTNLPLQRIDTYWKLQGRKIW